VSPDAVSVVRFLGVWLVAFICLTAGLLVLAWLMLKVGSWRTTRLARRDAAKANAEREERERLRYSTSDGSTFWANRLRDAGGNPTPVRRERTGALEVTTYPLTDEEREALTVSNDHSFSWGGLVTYSSGSATQTINAEWVEQFECMACGKRGPCSCVAVEEAAPRITNAFTEECANQAEPLSHPLGWVLCFVQGFICAVSPEFDRVHRYSPSQLCWVGAGNELSQAAIEALGRTA
jgi:hypothetical protein